MSGRITPTLPVALPAVVAAGAFAALVGGDVSRHAPCAWPDEVGLVDPLELGLPPLLDPPHAAAARATVMSDAVTATRGAVRLDVGTVGLRGGFGIRCCRAVAALLPDDGAVSGFCQVLVTTMRREGTKMAVLRHVARQQAEAVGNRAVTRRAVLTSP